MSRVLLVEGDRIRLGTAFVQAIVAALRHGEDHVVVCSVVRDPQSQEVALAVERDRVHRDEEG